MNDSPPRSGITLVWAFFRIRLHAPEIVFQFFLELRNIPAGFRFRIGKLFEEPLRVLQHPLRFDGGFLLAAFDLAPALV